MDGRLVHRRVTLKVKRFTYYIIGKMTGSYDQLEDRRIDYVIYVIRFIKEIDSMFPCACLIDYIEEVFILST